MRVTAAFESTKPSAAAAFDLGKHLGDVTRGRCQLTQAIERILAAIMVLHQRALDGLPHPRARREPFALRGLFYTSLQDLRYQHLESYTHHTHTNVTPLRSRVTPGARQVRP